MTKKSKRSKAESDVTFEHAMRELIAERFSILWSALPAAVEGKDTEGVHDVRVASRRLRAAMDVADSCFPGDWYKPLHSAVKEITGALGEVRDREVLLAHFSSAREQRSVSDRPGADRLTQRIEKELEVARADMIVFLAGIERKGIVDESIRRFGDRSAARLAPKRDV